MVSARWTVHDANVTEPDDAEALFMLRSPLAPTDAVERLRDLGPHAPRDSAHRQVVAIDVHSTDDPFQAPIEVEIEPRRRGSFVTARVGENAFLHEFSRVVRCVLTLYALVAVGYVCVEIPGVTKVRALLGITLGWLLLLAVVSLCVWLATREAARNLNSIRLRHQLARLLSRQ